MTLQDLINLLLSVGCLCTAYGINQQGKQIDMLLDIIEMMRRHRWTPNDIGCQAFISSVDDDYYKNGPNKGYGYQTNIFETKNE